MNTAPRALIHLQALKHNLARARQAAPNSRTMAIIKANGYGHGLLRVARALEEQAAGFGVARTHEAITLRRGGIRLPITLLEGFHDRDELAACQHYQLTPVIHHRHQLELLEQQAPSHPIACWIKLDTGMHRVGFAPEHSAEILRRLTALACITQPPGFMTHLACADDLHHPLTRQQLERFHHAAPKGALTSLANSAATLGWPEAHGDWVRPGIMLYGASPFIDQLGADHQLQPAMTLETRLIAINPVPKGDTVGYGASWRCPCDMRLGVAAIGYGDGYPRHAPSGTPTLVKGRIAPLVGRVSMDMITIDLRQQPDAKVGDRVLLWGEGLPAEVIAAQAGTIAYELFCGVTSRVERQEVQ